MKATGIIRRIDDLGRVVIPKEIRRSMHIKEGDALEIFTSEQGVIFNKYNPCDGLKEAADNLIDELTYALDYKEGEERRECAAMLEKVKALQPELEKIAENT